MERLMSDTLTSGRPDDAPATTAKGRGGAPDLSGKTVTINRPPQELYAFWRDFTNLPKFMDNIVSVEPLDDRRSRWVVKAPGGGTVEWTAVITEDRPGQCIGWASEEGADVPNSGRIDFRPAPGDRGSWVTATIDYDPPGGMIGKVIAKLFQREPHIQARHDLRRFKQLMETGEVATGARTRREREERD